MTKIETHGSGALRISPGTEISLTRVRRALVAGGLEPVIDWRSKEIYLPAAVLGMACAALEGIELDVSENLVATRNELLNQEASLAEGKRLIQRLCRPGKAREELMAFQEIDRLDPHQVEAVAVALQPSISGFCLFDEQGLGKTVSALYAFHLLRKLGSIDALFVVCPKNMILEWERDAEHFFPGMYVCNPIIGSMREKRVLIEKEADIYITNFETPIRLSLRLKELFASKPNGVLMVVDESFYVKNTQALRSRALRSLRTSARKCIVLCGTPAPNRPHDLVEQFNIADRGAAFRGVNLPQDRVEAVPIVQNVLRDRGLYLRRLKEEALPDLPPKSFQTVTVPLQPIQREVYSEYLKAFISELEQVTDSSFKKQLVSFMARRTRLLQVCSNPLGIQPQYKEIPSKLLALDSLLVELVNQRGEKVVLWSYYTASLEAILARFARFSPVRFDGKVADPHLRREAVRRFQEDDKTMLFVGNLAAAAAGLTLHRARYAIYESLSNQGAHYFQSLDRIHRRGQEREVEYIILLCDRTIEQSEYDRLMVKERMSQTLLGDQTKRPRTRQEMLEEAQNAAKVL